MSGHVRMKVGEFCFWSAIVLVIGVLIGAAFLAPRQADASAGMDSLEAAHETAAPTVEHLCRGALVSTRAQAEKLEQMIHVKWGMDAPLTSETPDH